MINRYWKIASNILKVFFRLLYGPMAWSYDLVAAVVSIGRWRTWVSSTLPYLPGPRVLELGPGPGHLLSALSKQGISAVGLDASRQMTLLAYIRGKRKGVEYKVVNGYAQFIPFKDGSYDQVVATFPTDYAWDPRTLAEIFRVLRPTGSLILLPVAWITGRGLLDRLARTIFQLTGQAPPLGDTSLAKQIERLLEAEGFSVQTNELALESSRVLLVRGEKPGSVSGKGFRKNF